MTILTTAMTRPITKYLTIRLTSSEKSKPIWFLIYNKNKKIYRNTNNKQIYKYSKLLKYNFAKYSICRLQPLLKEKTCQMEK
jgi:hypothetical protein